MQELLTATRIHSATQIAIATGRHKWLSDDVVTRGIGRLLLRITANGVQRFYFRPPRSSHISPKLMPIGPYSRILREGYFTLNQARLKVSEFQLDLRSEVPANSLHHPDSTANASAPPAIKGDLQATLHRGTTGTLLQLCRMYAQSLEDEGKKSAGDVKCNVERYIAPSSLAHSVACDLKAPQFTNLLRDVDLPPADVPIKSGSPS